MATEPKVDKQLEHQLEVVKERHGSAVRHRAGGAVSG